MKKISLLFILFLLALPSAASAELDPRCFPKSDCLRARAESPFQYAAGTAEEGFYTGTDADQACQDMMINSGGNEETEIGFCLPVSQANTQVKIGKRGTFGNIADYIAFLYKYSLTAGAVLAVVMIIIAGVEYIISGGDSGKITAAKKRIANALIGLVLIATTYTILNTINPALIALRLPGVWMIYPQAMGAQYCSDLRDGTVLALAANPGQEELTPYSAELFSGANRTTMDNTQCGAQYYVNGAGEQTCQGTGCNNNEVCVPITFSRGEPINAPSCSNKKFTVRLSIDPIGALQTNLQSLAAFFGNASFWLNRIETGNEPWLDTDKIRVYPLCEIVQSYNFDGLDSPHANFSNVTYRYFGQPIEIENNIVIYQIQNNEEDDIGLITLPSYYIEHDWEQMKSQLENNGCKYSVDPVPRRRAEDGNNLVTDSHIIEGAEENCPNRQPNVTYNECRSGKGNLKGFIIQYFLEQDSSSHTPVIYISPRASNASGVVSGHVGTAYEIFGGNNLKNLTFNNCAEYSKSGDKYVFENTDIPTFDITSIEENGIMVQSTITSGALQRTLGYFQNAWIAGNYYTDIQVSTPRWYIKIHNNGDDLEDLHEDIPCSIIGATWGGPDYMLFSYDSDDNTPLLDIAPTWIMQAFRPYGQ